MADYKDLGISEENNSILKEMFPGNSHLPGGFESELYLNTLRFFKRIKDKYNLSSEILNELIEQRLSSFNRKGIAFNIWNNPFINSSVFQQDNIYLVLEKHNNLNELQKLCNKFGLSSSEIEFFARHNGDNVSAKLLETCTNRDQIWKFYNFLKYKYLPYFDNIAFIETFTINKDLGRLQLIHNIVYNNDFLSNSFVSKFMQIRLINDLNSYELLKILKLSAIPNGFIDDERSFKEAKIKINELLKYANELIPIANKYSNKIYDVVNLFINLRGINISTTNIIKNIDLFINNKQIQSGNFYIVDKLLHIMPFEKLIKNLDLFILHYYEFYDSESKEANKAINYLLEHPDVPVGQVFAYIDISEKLGFSYEKIKSLDSNVVYSYSNIISQTEDKDVKFAIEDIESSLEANKKFKVNFKGLYEFVLSDLNGYISQTADIVGRNKKGDSFLKELSQYTFQIATFYSSLSRFNQESKKHELIKTAYSGSNNVKEFVNRLYKLQIYLDFLHNSIGYDQLADVAINVFKNKIDLSRDEIKKFVEVATSINDESLYNFKEFITDEEDQNDYNNLLKIKEIWDSRNFKIPSSLLKECPKLSTKLYLADNAEEINQFKQIAKEKPKHEKLNINVKVDNDNYYFKNLGHLNIDHFMIGIETNCCQRLGGPGHFAAVDSFINPLADVLVLYNKDNQIISQSYFHYVPEDNGIILDDVENSVGPGEKIKGPKLDSLYIELTEKLLALGYKYVWCGKQFNNLTIKDSSKVENDPRHFEVDTPYRDFFPDDFIDLTKFVKQKISEESSEKPSKPAREHLSDRDLYEQQMDKKFNMKRSLLELSKLFFKFSS